MQALVVALAANAGAAVTEPNGIQVPCAIPCVTPPDTNYNETTLQSFFTAQGESINALNDASTDPGIFQPLCNFKATLVLSQSQANGGIAWYNVPADSMSAPTMIYPIIPVTATAGGTVGQAISSADIVSNPAYLKGFIGFALTKYEGADNVAVYYSEYQRNQNCTGCTAGTNGPTGLPQTPGYWKMALDYPSSATPNAYYLAFEDWEGANNTTWFGNDGDFNDKVFKIEGVTCMGGGEPCDSGGQGACKPGLTECGLGGALVCKAQVTASPEKCDNFDNDCNGIVDDGDGLCPDPDKPICSQGVCVGNCNRGEFPCTGNLVCDPSGHCVDPSCSGISCPAGQACRNGACVGACDGVTCPLTQTCDLGSGRCVAPCDGVTCPSDQVCENGVCVANCSCRKCPDKAECNKASGQCVDTGCAAMTCDAGTICYLGACADPCAKAVCPGGATCTAGHCGDPLPTTGSDGSAGTGSGVGGAAGGLNFNTGGTSNGPSGGGTSSVTSTGASGPRLTDGATTSKAGCGCRVGTSDANGNRFLLVALGLAGLLAARRRQARSH
jgi:MYXO-CTERM domain-containing protein